jgi:hypothetical protein
VTVTSSNPGVVSVGSGASTTLVIPAGSVVVPTGVATVGAEGSSVLSFEFDGQRLDLLFVVGAPPASQLPAVVAPVIGVEVQP